ncbi:MAG: hypothetical protein J2P44_11230 [Candidatus Dormibacteraeota bacterium]|nr:hypothetical protein [Candidatus Dormibacteraeota bacterium]
MVTPGEERYFARREIKEAIAWAEAGGIAVHRNLDRYDGLRSGRGIVMRRPFLHVIGMRPVLEAWALRHHVPLGAIQPEGKRRVAHIDAFGSYAQVLLDRLDGEG